jgi:hypothetical protein
MAMSRGGMGKEVAGARMKKRAMGASRQGKKMAPAEMMMPPMAPMAMKKGGMAKKTYGSTEDIMGTGKTPASAKADYAKKMKVAGLKPKPEKKMMGGGMAMKPGGMGYKKGGIALMIVLGKGGGKKKSK